jgi:hypothetical protein
VFGLIFAENQAIRMHSKARLFKMAGASLAYIPMLVVLLARLLIVPAENPIVTGCVIFNLPALSLWVILQGYHVSPAVEFLSGLALLLAWSSLVAWLFWRIVGTFQGEDEAEDQHGRFDWVGFRVRFAIGFVVGLLSGWRFVKYTTSMQTLLIASIVGGFIGGMAFGLSRPPDFWSRP